MFQYSEFVDPDRTITDNERAGKSDLQILPSACSALYAVRMFSEIYLGKSSESVQCAMLKACDTFADMGQL